jgi:ADP-heptose:LPS heptosyltransferase
MALTEVQQFMLGKVGSRAKFSVANKTDIPKILLIELGAAGELVAASPFFDQLRKHFPHSEIVLVVGRSSYAAVEHNPNINRFILADDLDLYHGGLIRGALEFFRLIFKLRKEDFNLSFVLERGMAFRLLSCLAGIPVRVGFGRGREDFFLTHSVLDRQIQTESESYLDLLRKMDIHAVFNRTYYYLSDEEKDFLDLFLERHNLTDKEQVIALAPGGGGSAIRNNMMASQWPVQNYIELIQRFQREGLARIILVGGPDDRGIADHIIKACPECLNATDLSLGDMASVLRRCNLFVGSDNARNHIAVAMCIPCIRIFDPTDSRPWFSFKGANVASAASVKPSIYREGKFFRFSSAEYSVAVSVDQIWQHLKDTGRVLPQ